MTQGKAEYIKGTLDLLLGPSHGYAIAQRLQQISKDFFQVHPGLALPRASPT